MTDQTGKALTSRLVLDQIADKWTVLILDALCPGPLRFSALKRALDGITQASLTQALRRLERNGIVGRQVLSTAPVAVQYSITPLGRSLEPLFKAVETWSCENLEKVAEARSHFDVATGRSSSELLKAG